MKKTLTITSILALAALTVNAQEKTDPLLTISGSVDTYYKYDFSGRHNIPTSFASDQNSFSIGMIDLALKKKVSKASFVGEISFGPRGQAQSIPNGDGSPANGGNSFHIQNLYVSYDLTEKLSITGGYMATFVGYEVVAPTGNFNYSTSYLFTNGPFQNAGAKLTYAFSDKVALSAGMYNEYWNTYNSTTYSPTGVPITGKINTFGSQLMVAPVKGWTAYINLLSGPASGTIVDLTTTYQFTDAFKLGLNAANFDAPKPTPAGPRGGFAGAALYPQYAISPSVILGLRGEYFKTKNGAYTSSSAPAPGESVTAFTLTANIKGGPLTFIPEVRLDNASKDTALGFTNKFGLATRSASQFALAAVYAF